MEKQKKLLYIILGTGTDYKGKLQETPAFCHEHKGDVRIVSIDQDFPEDKNIKRTHQGKEFDIERKQGNFKDERVRDFVYSLVQNSVQNGEKVVVLDAIGFAAISSATVGVIADFAHLENVHIIQEAPLAAARYDQVLYQQIARDIIRRPNVQEILSEKGFLRKWNDSIVERSFPEDKFLLTVNNNIWRSYLYDKMKGYKIPSLQQLLTIKEKKPKFSDYSFTEGETDSIKNTQFESALVQGGQIHERLTWELLEETKPLPIDGIKSMQPVYKMNTEAKNFSLERPHLSLFVYEDEVVFLLSSSANSSVDNIGIDTESCTDATHLTTKERLRNSFLSLKDTSVVKSLKKSVKKIHLPRVHLGSLKSSMRKHLRKSSMKI